MTGRVWIATATLVLWAATAVWAERKPVELLLVGDYHGDEIGAESGEAWWAVSRESDSYRLHEASIEVSLVVDPILDGDGETTGKRVVTDSGSEVAFLVRGLGLEDGALPTVFAGATPLPPAEPLGLVLDSVPYSWRIEVAGAAGDDPDTPCRLLLESGGTSQPIASIWCVEGDVGLVLDETLPILLWAGDLDRDGRLDFLLDLSDHYNLSLPTLFVSGSATAGQIAAPVAELERVGC